mmetsp:Transcript_56080/g.149633  ORF Transcript_56080/g.149633 Transcript_56080/m.149633 type:complete len:337 (+) Transcript_56080:2374-3384(+)
MFQTHRLVGLVCLHHFRHEVQRQERLPLYCLRPIRALWTARTPTHGARGSHLHTFQLEQGCITIVACSHQQKAGRGAAQGYHAQAVDPLVVQLGKRLQSSVASSTPQTQHGEAALRSGADDGPVPHRPLLHPLHAGSRPVEHHAVDLHNHDLPLHRGLSHCGHSSTVVCHVLVPREALTVQVCHLLLHKHVVHLESDFISFDEGHHTTACHGDGSDALVPDVRHEPTKIEETRGDRNWCWSWMWMDDFAVEDVRHAVGVVSPDPHCVVASTADDEVDLLTGSNADHWTSVAPFQEKRVMIPDRQFAKFCSLSDAALQQRRNRPCHEMVKTRKNNKQ